MFLYGAIVQLVEHLLHTENVGGSNPSSTTKFLLACGVIGNTTDFDSVVSGSIPDTPARTMRARLGSQRVLIRLLAPD